MKRLLLPILFVVVLIFVILNRPARLVLSAQTLPVTKTLAWTDADTSITSYTVTLDGAVAGNPTTQSQSVTFTTAGTHTLTVTATNVWGTSAPATLTVDIAVPTVPANMQLR
jgi:PKD repeat protein